MIKVTIEREEEEYEDSKEYNDLIEAGIRVGFTRPQAAWIIKGHTSMLKVLLDEFDMKRK